MNIGVYGKTLTALITGLIGWATTVAGHPGGFGHIDAPLWIAFATVWAVAMGVYGVANAPASTDGHAFAGELLEAGPMRLHRDDITAVGEAVARAQAKPAATRRGR